MFSLLLASSLLGSTLIELNGRSESSSSLSLVPGAGSTTLTNLGYREKTQTVTELSIQSNASAGFTITMGSLNHGTLVLRNAPDPPLNSQFISYQVALSLGSILPINLRAPAGLSNYVSLNTDKTYTFAPDPGQISGGTSGFRLNLLVSVPEKDNLISGIYSDTIEISISNNE